LNQQNIALKKVTNYFFLSNQERNKNMHDGKTK